MATIPTDLNSISNPTAGGVIVTAWGDEIRAWMQFLKDPPTCSVYGAAQSLANDTAETLLAASENHDNDSMHSVTTNTGRITCVTAGRYLFTATVEFDANSTGRRLVYLRKNAGTTLGTDLWLLYSSAAPVSPTTAVGTATKMLVLAATDYVEVRANQNSGGALDGTLTEFAATMLTF